MKSGSLQNAPDFSPGMNKFICTGIVCMTYINTLTGEEFPFVLDVGSHYVRVPQDCIVHIDTDDTVQWNARKYDPHEHLDDTPVEVTLIRPMSLEQERENRLIALLAQRMGVSPRDLVETLEDQNDFEDHGDDDTPLSLHQIKVMEMEGDPSSLVVEPPPAKPAAPTAATSPSPAPVDTKAAPAPTPSAPSKT